MKTPLLAIVLLSIALSGVAQAAETKSFVYKKTKQGELKIHVHYPDNWKESDTRPAIVFFFGGGWTSGKVTQFEPQAKYLATRGMVAARADYRVKSRHGITPDACVEDAKSAVRWLRANAKTLGIDPEKIVASGGSAGAHIAACTGTTPGLEADDEDHDVSSRPSAMVLFNPVLNISSSDERLKKRGISKEIAPLISPTQQLKKETPPALILFGDEDGLYPQGQEYVAAAKKLGVRAEMFVAEGAKHGFFNRAPWYEPTLYRTDQFLNSLGYLEGEPSFQLR